MTVKLRSGQRPGDFSGLDVARRLAFDGAVAGISIHPRHASQRHKGTPDYALVRDLVDELPVPVLLSGGMSSAARVRDAFELTGAAGVLLARGSLGNPWLFEELLGGRLAAPTDAEVLAELDWVIACACEHLGVERAGRYLRKFYPWYIERLSARHVTALGGAAALRAAVQTAPSTEAVRELLAGGTPALAAA